MVDICFIGCGNMARAVIRGLKEKRPEWKLAATDPDRSAVERAGVDYIENSAVAACRAKCLLLAVKPYHADAVLDGIAPHASADTLIVSIMAGYPIAKIRSRLPGVPKVVRVMPNLAAQQLAAMSALTFTQEADEADRRFAREIFDSVGKTVVVDESLMDAVTAVSGSGTAYVYEFIRHLISGGVGCGLDEETARTLALQTVEGAVRMVEASTGSIEPMIDAVCSKGGTTIEAIATLRARGFGETIEAAVKACYDRSVEMGKNA